MRGRLVGDIEREEFAEGRLDATHGHRAIGYADVRAASADEGEVVAAVGECEGDSAKVLLIACLVSKLGGAVKDV